MSSDVDQLIVELWPGREVRVEPLHGGITNANFLVDLGDEQVVLRISGENTELLGIDRRHETAANHLASSIGIAPEVLANSENKGWMVTRFVAGRPIPPSELASEPMLGKFVKTLRRLHRAGSDRKYWPTLRTKVGWSPASWPDARSLPPSWPANRCWANS